jgi:NADPH-dependent 2,4-dienoyl-CoA reductase/sulfur reductase-like enzyme
MTRALICDPLLANKAAAGEEEDIRACIACNQACIGHFHMGFSISCIQHPETGREIAYGQRVRARSPRDVLVVGGGPGGLKAAAVAAQRGHRVTLHEAFSHVGGQILLAQLLPGRDEFGGAATNLRHEALRAGVEIVTKSRVSAQMIRELGPDVVVLATGARPYWPALEVMGEPVVLDAWQAAARRAATTGPRRGRRLAAATGSASASRGLPRAQKGHRVTLCVNGYAAGESLQQYVRDAKLAALQRERIAVVALVRPFGVDADSVYLQHELTEEPVVIERVSAMVLACGHEASNELMGDLGATDLQVVAVGDCVTPRTLEEAVLEGLVAASAI